MVAQLNMFKTRYLGRVSVVKTLTGSGTHYVMGVCANSDFSTNPAKDYLIRGFHVSFNGTAGGAEPIYVEASTIQQSTGTMGLKAGIVADKSRPTTYAQALPGVQSNITLSGASGYVKRYWDGYVHPAGGRQTVWFPQGVMIDDTDETLFYIKCQIAATVGIAAWIEGG